VTSYPELAISDFCETGSGGTPSRSNKAYYGGTVPWVKSGELREGTISNTEETITERAIKESSAKIVPSGSILLAMYGATVGRMAYLGVDAATNQAVCNIRPDPRMADGRYVFHCLQSKISHFLSRAAGGAQPNISQGVIRETKIPLPPLDEQRRIAAILDKADGLCRKRKRSLNLIDGMTQSIFSEMFYGDSGVEFKALAQLVDGLDRINYGVVQPGEEDQDGVQLIRVSDLANGRVNHSNLRRVSRTISDKHHRSLIRGNEILISCVGSIGEIAVATPREAGLNIARAVARVPIKCDKLRSFVAEYLRTPSAKSYFTKELRTVSQPTLNIKQISETLVPVPSFSRIAEFVERTSVVTEIIDLARDHAKCTDSLFTSLQHRAFSGQL
jgi:type I restriction enzyme, S subunit